MTTITLPAAVEAFVAATNSHDIDALVGVFAEDAIVRDDGTAYPTTAEIRSWIQSHMVGPKVVLTPTSFDDGRLIASADGEFDGGPLSFVFDFVAKDGLVAELSIDLA